MKVQKIIVGGLISLFLLAGLACQPVSPLESSKIIETPTPSGSTEKKDDFGQRLEAVQTANFDYIYAFRRKDGGEFNKEDKIFLKQHAPGATNQWVLTRDEKAVIAGSNYKFAPENLEALKSRFNVENYSKIIDDNNTNTNAAGNRNPNTNVTGSLHKNTNVIDNRSKNTNKGN